MGDTQDGEKRRLERGRNIKTEERGRKSEGEKGECLTMEYAETCHIWEG